MQILSKLTTFAKRHYLKISITGITLCTAYYGYRLYHHLNHTHIMRLIELALFNEPDSKVIPMKLLRSQIHTHLQLDQKNYSFGEMMENINENRKTWDKKKKLSALKQLIQDIFSSLLSVFYIEGFIKSSIDILSLTVPNSEDTTIISAIFSLLKLQDIPDTMKAQFTYQEDIQKFMDVLMNLLNNELITKTEVFAKSAFEKHWNTLAPTTLFSIDELPLIYLTLAQSLHEDVLAEIRRTIFKSSELKSPISQKFIDLMSEDGTNSQINTPPMCVFETMKLFIRQACENDLKADEQRQITATQFIPVASVFLDKPFGGKSEEGDLLNILSSQHVE